MNKRWLIILLLISFAFNLAIVGSFIYIKCTFGNRMCPPPPPPHLIQGSPDFPKNEIWERLPIDDSMHELRKQFMESKRDLMIELAKDPIDEKEINSILENSLINQSALERKLGERLLMLRKTMTAAEEAREFFGKRAEMNHKRPYDRFDKRPDPKQKRRMK